MSDNGQHPEASVGFMQGVLQERAIASVVMGENGNLVVQYCDRITVYKADNSAALAAKLLKIIAEVQEA